jgi:FkbM family methyltransferase
MRRCMKISGRKAGLFSLRFSVSTSVLTMEEQIRTAARRYLAPAIRRPLGRLAGKLNEAILKNLQGLLFDLKGNRFKADGCTFTIPRDVTTRLYRATFLSDDYEQDERKLIKEYLKPEDRVVELGGCLGIVSCVTNRLLADKTNHVVVEANPFCIAALYRNKELNKAGFLIEHCAVDSKREVTFYLHPVYIVGGTVQRPNNCPVRLPAKSLRQLDAERGPFTALIIDIEGSELEVFKDSLEILRRLRVVIVELHEFAIGDDGVERCRELLRNSGLKFARREGICEAWVRS